MNEPRRVLNPGVEQYARKLLPSLLRSLPGVELETIGFDQDHVHMVMTIPPKYAIADVIAQLKSQSASHLRKKFTWLARVSTGKKTLSGDLATSPVVSGQTKQPSSTTLNTKDARMQIKQS